MWRILYCYPRRVDWNRGPNALQYLEVRSTGERRDGTVSDPTNFNVRPDPQQKSGTVPASELPSHAGRLGRLEPDSKRMGCRGQISTRLVALDVEPECLHVERFVIRSRVRLEVQIRFQFDRFFLVDRFLEEFLHNALDL